MHLNDTTASRHTRSIDARDASRARNVVRRFSRAFLGKKASRTRRAMLGVGALVAVGLMLGAFALLQHRQADVVRPVSFAMYPVPDCDPFANLTVGPDAPRGLMIMKRSEPAGLDAFAQKRTATRSYARLALQDDETVDALIARARPWLEAHVSLPVGVRLGFRTIMNYDTHTPSAEGVESVLLSGDAIVTHADIFAASVEKQDDAHYAIVLMLTDAGKERFRVASRGFRNREIAILLDGRVDHTVVPLGEVGDGILTLPLSDPEDLAEQTRLARALLASRR